MWVNTRMENTAALEYREIHALDVHEQAKEGSCMV
jgi:hypothetical protein